eukprot:COSAG01_NODE_18783_length_1053_cov_2.269392_2_plen_158_part_00
MVNISTDRECADEDPEVLLGAARLARQQAQKFGIHVPPKTLLRTRYHDCKSAGLRAKEPAWALLLEPCDFDLTVPIYGKQPWGEGPTLSWERRCDFAQQMASGLAFIHQSQQVHWDLKPGNILMKRGAGGEGWVLKVADFGMGDTSPGQVSHSGCPE